MHGRQKHPCRMNKAGLSFHIQKQLLKDIQEAGGIGDGISLPFRLSRLCDKHKDIQSEKGSNLHKQIRNKVYSWQKITQEEYNSILASIGIQTTQVLLSPQSSPQSQPSSGTPSSGTPSTGIALISPMPTPARSTPGEKIMIGNTMYHSPTPRKMLTYDDDNDDGNDDGIGKLEGLLLVLLSCHSLPCSLPHQSSVPISSTLISTFRNQMLKLKCFRSLMSKRQVYSMMVIAS